MITGSGTTDHALDPERIRQIIESELPAERIRDKRILVLTPDTTRTCPLPLMVRCLQEIVGQRGGRTGFHGRPGHPHSAGRRADP